MLDERDGIEPLAAEQARGLVEGHADEVGQDLLLDGEVAARVEHDRHDDQ